MLLWRQYETWNCFGIKLQDKLKCKQIRSCLQAPKHRVWIVNHISGKINCSSVLISIPLQKVICPALKNVKPQINEN